MPGTRQHRGSANHPESPAQKSIASLGPRERPRIGWAERFGLRPLRQGLRDAQKAITGRGATPATVWDLSSVKILKPRISIHTWAGRTRADGKVPVYNFFNRNQPPRSAPYSVKVSNCRDFQGGQWTYDGHVGTDFAVPVGTPIVTTAPGLVVRVDRELDHGGLKVCIDHGQSLFTTSSHLSRALVREGARVERGQVLGLSGASGIEFILFFPWCAPHLHLNVWLNGEAIDPFALEGEVSMWRRHNDPRPYDGKPPEGEVFEPSAWDPDGVEAAIDACRDAEIRQKARRFESLERRAAEILFHRVLSSAAFDDFPPLYRVEGSRRPCLDLPFRKKDFRGAWLPPVRPA
jgi:murein DD-endopeptidase MepM/ murein hydrolase activator NlpD